MDIGIPLERNAYEYRVGMTPQGVKLLVQAGHHCYVERGAGEGAGFRDEDYERAGARLAYNSGEVYERGEMVLKVGPPTDEEMGQLREGQTVCAFWHLAARPREVTQTLMTRNITAIAYETIQRDDGFLPVLAPLSEIAGRMSPQIAARWLQNDGGGSGILISGVAGVPPVDVCVIGAGVVGANAARAFVNQGARVFVLDRDLSRLQYIEDRFDGRVVTMVAFDFNIARVLSFCQVAVGAVLVPGERAPVVVTREMVKKMRPRSVILDISIDQGGCVETSRPTTHANPVFMEENVIHYCVPNMAGVVARTATHAYLNAAWPYVQMIANAGAEQAIAGSDDLRRGAAVHNGQIVSEKLASLFRGTQT